MRRPCHIPAAYHTVVLQDGRQNDYKSQQCKMTASELTTDGIAHTRPGQNKAREKNPTWMVKKKKNGNKFPTLSFCNLKEARKRGAI